MKYESLGCYNATDHSNNMAMPELLFNEISPSIGNFNGYMMQFDESWEAMYPQLLCRCARAAGEKGYKNFAIRNKGRRFENIQHLRSCAGYVLIKKIMTTNTATLNSILSLIRSSSCHLSTSPLHFSPSPAFLDSLHPPPEIFFL